MDSSSNTSSETLTLSSVSYSMERTEEQSLTSYSDPTPYDVFLSFNGKNSRYKFTSHLYEKLDSHGIRTYMDDPELRVGEVISEALIQAIKDSKIYVAVFTENYADSSWCLDELVEMYKCYQTHQRLIIGVYCNIDPSIVRHQTHSFKTSFEKHETDREGRPKVPTNKTKQWRTALGNVAAFSGKHISSQRSEADVVNDILERILLEINPKALHVTRHPVGMDTRVKRITTLLRRETEGVLMFGIYGMRGVGKTTLAKAVYNQLFPNFKGSCCFLADVRTKGLASLQQKLINDVLKSKKTLEVHSVDEGIMLIDARICKTKVLVVIDDVDKKEQVYYLVRNFESCSVVIITTTDEAILDGINVRPQFRFMLQRLDHVEACSLFTKYAFENGKVNNTLMQCFFKRIQELADGLPLALAVFGSYLCDQHDEEGWRSYINKLELNPDTDINGRLLITLNAIEGEDPMLKKLFLDIACFFVGKPKGFTLGILETYYVYVAHKIDILKKRSLLTINRMGVLEMHGLLQDMGRDAVRNNFPHDQPQKHSRLWAPKDICDVLEEGKGTDVIEGIIPYYEDANEEITFTTETFEKMINLRFLHLKNVNLHGSFQQKFGSLRWLRWDCCLLMELPSGFRPGKLVVLELRDSKIKKWELNKAFVNLKTLNMSNSINLTTMPDFTKLPNLETLTLNWCESLEKVDIPINSLTKLVEFNLRGCVKLRSIHVISTSSLEVMEVLNVSGCEKLEKLPHQLCENTSLRKIYLGTRNEYLEAPFKHLNLSSENKFTALPSFYSHFLKLEHLYLSGWPNLLSIEQLPPNLKKLSLHGCMSLVRLPNLFSLTQLEHLDIGICSVLTEIQGLEECTSLRHLNLKCCNSSVHAKILTTPFFQVLENLKTLDMSVSPYFTEMSDFTMLPSLESLKIKGCPRLEKVLISAKSLTELVSFDLRGCRTLEEIYISNESLLKLVSLNLRDCVELRNFHIGSSSSSQLLNLTYLNLDSCCKLSSIEQLPPNLKELHLFSCKSLESLPNLFSLTQLQVLDITRCSSLTEIKGLEELTSIYDLGLDNCNSTLHTQILTESFFQIYSGLKHMITISAGQFPNWFKSDLYKKKGYTYVIPKCGLDILAVIIFLEDDPEDFIKSYDCDVENVTSGKSYARIESMQLASVFMIILPRSIFSAKAGDELCVRSYGYIQGIHLVYDE